MGEGFSLEERGTILPCRLISVGLRFWFRLRLRIRRWGGCRRRFRILAVYLDLDPIGTVVGTVYFVVLKYEEENDAGSHQHQKNDPDPGRAALRRSLVSPPTLIIAFGILTHCLTSVVVIRVMSYPFGHDLTNIRVSLSVR